MEKAEQRLSGVCICMHSIISRVPLSVSQLGAAV
jgi:hypothetical protein